MSTTCPSWVGSASIWRVGVAGRRQSPGRPVEYGTTPAFLELFSLKDLGELPDGADAEALAQAASAAGTGFLPGIACSNAGGMRHCLRLSFAHYSVADIHEGIARLKRAFAP